MEKIPLILFSGGLDSTYLLWKQLQKGPCDVLYVTGDQFPAKVIAEKEARMSTLTQLNGTMEYQVRTEIEVEVNTATKRAFHNHHKFSQPSRWLMGAMLAISSGHHSELQIGYCQGDQIIAELEGIKQCWQLLQSFSNVGTPVPVVFPAVFQPKWRMLEELPAPLLKHVWICETPLLDTSVIKSCGNCQPCKRHRLTLIEYDIQTNEPFNSALFERYCGKITTRYSRGESCPS